MRALRLLSLITLMMLAMTAHIASAQSPAPNDEVLLDFEDTDLRTVLSALAAASGANIAFSDIPQRRVTLRMQRGIPKSEMLAFLRSFAASNGLRLVEDGGLIRIELGAIVSPTQPTGGGPAGVKASASVEATRLFPYPLRHAKAARLAATLSAVFSEGRAPSASGPGPVSSFAEPTLNEALRPDSMPLDPQRPPPQAAAPSVGSLSVELTGDVQIVPDEATNSLLVRAQPRDWETIRQTIDALDQRPLQVLIEVIIAEVQRTNDLSVSLGARGSDRSTDPTVRGTLGGGGAGGPNTEPGSLILELLRGGPLSLTGSLAVLAQRGDVRIVSRPVVMAQNNQEARILVGSERPFVQVFRSLPTDNGVRDQVVQYRDVGTKLRLVPTINRDGYVNLLVSQEVSTATAETQFGAPVISTREAATQLYLRDGQLAVIGGLVDRQQVRSRSGIPLLMDLPLIGGLFGSSTRQTRTTELFLFITPYILTSDGDIERMVERLREKAPLLRETLPEWTPPAAPQQPAPKP